MSRFEDRAPVRAARAWASAQAAAVNANDRSMVTLDKVATPAGVTFSRHQAKNDLDHHYRIPGPPPFTPVGVHVTGNQAVLDTCFWTAGWSVDPATGKPVGPRTIQPVTLYLHRTAGTWKFDHGYLGTFSCTHVKVHAIRW